MRSLFVGLLPLAAVDVDERGERDVPRVGGDQRGEAERPPADEAREDRRPIVPRGLRSVLVVSMVPVKCYKAGERENEEHVAAGLEADGAVAHGVCSPLRALRRGAHVRSSRRRTRYQCTYGMYRHELIPKPIRHLEPKACASSCVEDD